MSNKSLFDSLKMFKFMSFFSANPFIFQKIEQFFISWNRMVVKRTVSWTIGKCRFQVANRYICWQSQSEQKMVLSFYFLFKSYAFAERDFRLFFKWCVTIEQLNVPIVGNRVNEMAMPMVKNSHKHTMDLFCMRGVKLIALFVQVQN